MQMLQGFKETQMRRTKCKYCKCHKGEWGWESTCTNPNSYDYNGGECVEQDKKEPIECNDKVEKDE